MSLEDESKVSEINILPDGRVCLFGASRQILEIMDTIVLGDPELKERIERLRTTDVRHAEEPNEACSARNNGPINNRVRP